MPRKLPSRVHEELRSKGLTPQKDYGKIETNVAVIVKRCSGLRMKKRRDWKDGDESGSDREELQRGTYQEKNEGVRVVCMWVSYLLACT